MSKFSNRIIKSKIKKIKKFLNKTEGGEPFAEMISDCYEMLMENRDTLLTKIDQQTKVRADEDFIEVLEAEGSTHRYTINPMTGRHTLKLAKGVSDQVKKDLIDIVELNMDTNIPLTVLRGKISWVNGWYKSTLSSENKRSGFEVDCNI